MGARDDFYEDEKEQMEESRIIKTYVFPFAYKKLQENKK